MYRLLFLTTCLGTLLIATAAFPLEIKDIQNLFPPQNTVLAGSIYETKVDRQLGDSEEEEKIRKACVHKQNAENPEETTTYSSADGFEDNTPLNGTIVDDPMEVKIYRAECDD